MVRISIYPEIDEDANTQWYTILPLGFIRGRTIPSFQMKCSPVNPRFPCH